jgi:hypothetical protein
VNHSPIANQLRRLKDELSHRPERIHADQQRRNGARSADFSEQARQCENDEVVDRIGESTRAGAALPTLAYAAEAMPKLDQADPLAKALGYVESAGTIDPSKEATFTKGRTCAGCALYQGAQAHAGYAPCAAVPGKSVSAAGWCRAFAAKT